MSLNRGAVLGRYEIVAPIGAGGMGEVYRASDVTLRREIALKILPESVVGDTTRFARFEQEARATAALRHPNIVTIHDFGISDYGPYLVTELLEGETLSDVLARGGLPLRRVISWAQQILRGIAAAHARGIIHRDLKPGNIFVTAEGVVKILDFGLAKVHRAERGESLIDSPTENMSAAGAMVGTVGYMSPEQIVAGEIDARTDIFSFGVVLHEMLTRRSPFLRATSAETIAAILRDDPPPLDAGAFPPALALTLQRCLAKNREERFHSAHDLALHLETIEISSTTGSGATIAGSAPLPHIEQITFRRGNIMGARFAPDGSIVYGASWNDESLQLYVSHRGTPESRGLGIAASIHSISRNGEMAVSLGRRSELGFQFYGTLGRAPLAGGVPRSVANGIYDADWSPDGKQLAITRRSDSGFRLEYPMGTSIYESPSWLSDFRVSPNGTEIAFVEHPFAGDTFGHVKVVDLDGNAEQLTSDMYVCWGLAWHPLSGEIWYSAAPAQTDESHGVLLYAVSRRSKPREVFSTLGSLVLRDIAADGTVLVTGETLRRHIVGHVDGEEHPRDLSWFDWSFPMVVSADGTLLLFEEQGVATGGRNTFYIRGMDGSPAVRLDHGRARDLSPDGQYVLAFREEGAVEQLMMVPTGAGESRAIEVRGIDHFQTARFLPDGEAIVVVGSRAGEGQRLWRCAVTGGDAVPLTEPIVGSWFFIAISPDGNFVATLDKDQMPILCSTSGTAAPRAIPRAQRGDSPVYWAHENSLLICRREDRASHLFSVDLTSGDTKFVRTLQPADIAGVQGIFPIHYARNGRSFVYGYRLLQSSLFIIKGLR